MNAPHTNNPFEKNDNFEINHDPEYIKFAYWSTLISFNAKNPAESRREQKTIFLNNPSKGSPLKEGQVDTFISVKNNYKFPVLNFYIFSKRAGKIIFKLPEIPVEESIRIEFKREGFYEIHFFIAGSTSFSKITLNALPCKSISASKNFDWDLKSSW